MTADPIQTLIPWAWLRDTLTVLGAAQPYEVAFPKKGKATVTAVSFYADDLDAAIATLRTQITRAH